MRDNRRVPDEEPLLLRARTTTAQRVVAYGWFVLAGLAVVDTLVRGQLARGLLVVAAVVLVSVVTWVVSVRPELRAGRHGLVVRNPLRDVVVPWAALCDVDARDTVRLHTGGLVVRVWAVQAGNRTRARAFRPARRRALRAGDRVEVGPDVEAGVYGRSPADYVAGQVRDLWTAHRDRPGGAGAVRVHWSPVACGLLAAALAFMAVAALR